MNPTAPARAPRGPLREPTGKAPRGERGTALRLTALMCTGLMSGATLLLAGCSGSAAGSSGQAGTLASGARAVAPAAPEAGLPPAAGAARTAQPAKLALASQSIIFTASLTIQATDVPAAASRATAIATAAGGYVSGEHASASPAGPAQARVTLQLKIPVAQYPATLGKLTAMPGTRQISLSQQAQDVTQQVADVSSLVTSGQAAIAQLDALLKRTGTVADLLTVQEQINAQESSLEALLAQQRALARETSYATVSITLAGQHPRSVRHGGKQKQHGFVAGLTAGWRGLRLVVSAILTALGAALPFLALAAVVGGAGYAGRGRLRRLLRRGSPPTTAA